MKETQKLYNDVKEAIFVAYSRDPDNKDYKRAIDNVRYLVKKLKEKYQLDPDPIEQQWLDK